MKHHVLAGDALAADFKKTDVDGEIIVCRECLIDGDLRAANLEDFWNARAKYIESAFGAHDYRKKVVGEFEKLLDLPENAQVFLWFEDELFCQANMWFCLSLLQNRRIEIYRVAPVVRSETDVWKGFGNLSEKDLEKCFAGRIKFTSQDIMLGANLWKAFQNRDFAELEKLGATKSNCYPKLKEVCAAAIVIESRPKEILREITAQGETDFDVIFARFGETAGVYGFGDSQVKRVWREL